MHFFLSIYSSFELSSFDWVLALTAAFLVGISKSGIKGISVLFVTMLVIVYGAKPSTGILMPMLIAGDIFAVIYYKRHTKWSLLWKLLPWMIIGVVIGAVWGKDISEHIFRQLMAWIILLTVILMFWWDRQKSVKVPDYLWFASVMGFSAGFTTMIGNLAGAFTNLYFLAMRVPKNVFIGTAAWLFFIINLFKLPFHVFYWETIDLNSFKMNLALYPALILGLFIGVRMVEKIKEVPYRRMILILTALGALIILFGIN